MSWEPVIGLEIHVQLSTRTKMFCGCEPSFGDEANVHTCPVCLGHPGTLPVPNRQALHFGLQIAAALECTVAPRSTFHRKNYFYPDLPKGYQISQHTIPLASAGRLGDVRIHRVHLEEDAAKLIHLGDSGRIHGSKASLVDFNRGGTPLVEIVTEPDIRSAAVAREWLTLLRTTIRQLGVSDVNMEEGSLRADANVSLRPAGEQELGVKAELKNMNSFRFIERGIDAELSRQREVLDGGGQVEQETFHFVPQTGELTPMRSKEHIHDYRYFPEPDLVALAPTAEMIAAAREALPELPAARQERLSAELGLAADAASQFAFDPALGDFFEAALNAGDGVSPQVIANWVSGDLVAILREAGLSSPAGSQLTPEALAKLAAMVESKEISRGVGHDVLATIVADGRDPGEIVASEGLAALGGEGELAEIVDRAIKENAAAVENVAAGNEKAIGAIVGAVMRETKGRADGSDVDRLIRERLGL